MFFFTVYLKCISRIDSGKECHVMIAGRPCGNLSFIKCNFAIIISGLLLLFFLHRRRGGGGQLQETGPGQAQQQTFLSGLELPVRGVTSAVSEGGPCEPSQFLFKNCLQREDKIENSFFPQMLYVTNYLLPNNENFIYSCICLLRQGLLCLYLSRTGITGMYHHRVL